MITKGRFTLLAGALLALVPLAGCSDSNDPAGPGGASDFNVSVGSGVTPAYTWSTGAAASVSVVRVAAPTVIVWGLADPFYQLGQANLTSPVSHGSVKTGTVTSFSEEPTLTAGVQYRVIVTLPDGRTGWTEFTP